MSITQAADAADIANLARANACLRSWRAPSGDGVEVTFWDNQGDGRSPDDALPVAICAGLGTPPQAWPTLLGQPERYHVVGTYYRGTEGAPHPEGPPPTIDDHVVDMIAAIDNARFERALWAGWSMGVNIAAEAAVRHADRVAGVLGVAGVPGDTLGAFFGMTDPRLFPSWARRALAGGVLELAVRGGGAVNKLKATLSPHTFAWMCRHTGMALPGASATYMDAVATGLLAHDFRWYFTLGRSLGRHALVDLPAIKAPTTLLAGRFDVITSAAHARRCAELIPDCRLHVLHGTHFLPIEWVGEVERELLDLAVRAGYARG